jgi:hypothetical protein
MGASPKPFQLKVYPNGEFAVHVQRKMPVEPVEPLRRTDDQEQTTRAVQAHGIEAVRAFFGSAQQALHLGLSTPPNLQAVSKRPVRYGLKGMPGRARKMVRNACYLLERDCGRENLSFLTLTVPDLPDAKMKLLHAAWSKVLIAVRQKLTLRLTNGNITDPRIVVVSEIQEKRYERTGYPILHLHCLFRGRNPYSAWAVDKSEIQQLWETTISSIVGDPVDCSNATRIEPVRKSAENYMGKYMSKGVAAVEVIVEAGYADWLPRQWWGMTRSLSQEIRSLIRITHQSATALWHGLKDNIPGLCQWYRAVHAEAITGEKYLVAFYGKLTTEMNNSIESEICCT